MAITFGAISLILFIWFMKNGAGKFGNSFKTEKGQKFTQNFIKFASILSKILLVIGIICIGVSFLLNSIGGPEGTEKFDFYYKIFKVVCSTGVFCLINSLVLWGKFQKWKIGLIAADFILSGIYFTFLYDVTGILALKTIGTALAYVVLVPILVIFALIGVIGIAITPVHYGYYDEFGNYIDR